MTNALRKLKPVLWAAVVALIALFLWKNASEILSYPYDIAWPYIATSFAVVLLAYLVNVCSWVMIASHYGARATWVGHARAWSVSRLGRYVPGKVTTLYLRIEGYEQQQRGKAGVSLYIEILSSLIAICSMVLASWFLGLLALEPYHAILLGLALGAMLVVSSAGFLRTAFSKFTFLGRLAPPRTRPDGMLLAKAVMLQTVVMMLHGLSLVLAIRAFAEIGLSALAEVTVAYYFAGLAGMLALFAPAGLGVREAVLVGLLQSLVPLPVAVAAVALIRVLSASGELFLAGAFVSLHRADATTA